MKFFRAHSELLALLLLFFIFTGFFGFGKKANKSQTPETSELPQATSQKVIAILPIQKTFQKPIYLSNEPGFLTVAKRMFQTGKFRLGKTVDYDPAYVEDELGKDLSNGVLKNGFLVFTPAQLAPYLRQFDFDKELPFDELTQSLKTDAFLLVTLTDWEADDYDRSGTAIAGFQAVLIDAKTKHAVWTNEAKAYKLVVPSKDFLHSKSQKDVLKDLARRILKKFPKKEWHEA